MKNAISFIIKILLAFSFTAAHAGEIQAKLSTGGFLGDRALAVAYEIPAGWRFLLGYGNTIGLGDNIHQFNTTAEYSWFKNVRLHRDMRWTPLTTGLGGVYTPNKEFFLESSEDYPEKTYYQQTAFHALLLFGSQLRARIKNFRFYAEYFVSISDTYLIAQYNNTKWNSHYCCSSGFSLIIPF